MEAHSSSASEYEQSECFKRDLAVHTEVLGDTHVRAALAMTSRSSHARSATQPV